MRLLSLLLLLTSLLSAADRRPNLVFFLIDDLSHFTMTPYGGRELALIEQPETRYPIQMPEIEKLSTQGMRCDQAYVYPLCENTRVALMTGMHNGRNLIQPKSLHASQITFGDVFKRAGYKTGMYGKWKQTRGTPAIPAKDYISKFGWDDYTCFDVVGERYRFLDPGLVVNGKSVNYLKEGKLDPLTGRRAYGPDICNRAALKFIDDNKDEPFFLYYPMILVHDEHTPTPDTKPASAYDEFDLNRKYGRGHGTGDDRRYFGDMIAYTDKLIGKVMDKLDEHGLTENTLVVLMGDNGTKEPFRVTMADGSTRDGGKGGTDDGGEHVGLFFRWPGKLSAKGSGYNGLVDVVDLYPTVLDACGIKVPNGERIDGVSHWPQLTGKSKTPARRAIYHWFNANNTLPDMTHKRESAFTADFKRYAPDSNYPEGRLFDRRKDPEETGGPRGEQIAWSHHFHAGLPLDTLDAEQRKAWSELGKVLRAKAAIPVKGLRIGNAPKQLKVGKSTLLSAVVHPTNATRNNVIWVSSNPKVASIDKFGEITAHQPGDVEVRLYSWEDAHPVANGRKPEFRTDGITANHTLRIAP